MQGFFVYCFRFFFSFFFLFKASQTLRVLLVAALEGEPFWEPGALNPPAN